MKKVILLYIILFTQAIYAQTTELTLTEEQHSINFAKENNNFLIDTLVRLLWEESSWVNDMMWENNYNDQNIETDSYSFVYEENEWQPRAHVLKSYDERDNNIEYLVKNWQDSTWINRRRYVKTYDDNDNLIYFEYQNWIEGVWETWNRNNRIYDDQNNVIEELSEKWVDSNWVNYFKMYYYYTEELQTGRIFMLWTDSSWVNSIRRSYNYDENSLLLEEYYETWEDNNWQYNSRTIYTYNEKQNLNNSLKEIWSDEIWNNNEHETYVYDANNNNIEILFQQWEDSIWTNSYKEVYSYIPITSVASGNNLITEFKLLQNYPNPFNPSTTIKYSIAHSVIASGAKQSQKITSVTTFPRNDNVYVTLRVYDILGREVATLVDKQQKSGTYEVKFDPVSSNLNLVSGIYFYKLHAGNFIKTKKMLLLK